MNNRHRHLLSDLHSLLPHSRKDAKLDTKTQLHQLNELADLYNCNNVMFFEARKGKDLYIWLSKPPNGPTLKMHCQNVHTMEELNFTGNCLKGSRPILSFDATFDESPHLRVVKELLTHSFGVPQSSRKVKPFVDHVMGFTVAGGRVWIRCYQIAETEAGKKKITNGAEEAEGDDKAKSAAASALPSSKAKAGETSISLVEIGPRLVLTPIVILEGSFGGPVIYENKEFISPNQVRFHGSIASLLLSSLHHTDKYFLLRSDPTSARAKQAATTAVQTTSRADRPASATWACARARVRARSTSWTRECFSHEEVVVDLRPSAFALVQVLPAFVIVGFSEAFLLSLSSVCGISRSLFWRQTILNERERVVGKGAVMSGQAELRLN